MNVFSVYMFVWMYELVSSLMSEHFKTKFISDGELAAEQGQMSTVTLETDSSLPLSLFL